MIYEQVKKMISEQFDIDEDKVNEDTDFLDDLDADSLDIVELAMSMEETFGLPEIPEDDIRTIRTVGDVVDYITKKLG